jgi:chorismate mutase
MDKEFQIRALPEWINTDGKPLVIAGPCSAESETQMMATAKQLAEDYRVKIFRAGVWKPRTRPGGFEGMGEEALSWLAQVKQETRLATITEVAEPEHVKLALKYDVDMLWIGARTVVNPFAVEKLAQELKGVDIPVMVKNPVHPDANLWMGAIERFYKAGIRKLVAIHRGFYFFHKSPYRNAPMWEVPIALKSKMPQLPILCDPSHISGKRDLIEDISQKALDLEMDGLMIESHYSPDTAMSDKQQQLLPADLRRMLDRLKIRQRHYANLRSKLEDLRSEIDKIDAELLHVLARRMEIIDRIGDYKKENDITILQLKRWRNIITERLQMGTEQGLDEAFLNKILNIVHEESIRRQAEIFKH